jgi:amidase/aspartyl-tRNA(Asn)/glutamyl-tRNA(Gln) amidotransferase subunit A
MALSDELAYMPAFELAARIRRRQLSPVEVVDAFIARIEARNSSLNAFIYFGFEDARQAAKRAEAMVMAGEELGPLHGVPTAIKDLFDFKPGWPSTFGGVRALKNFIAHWHCSFAERIEKAGAIILGKTNSPTLGFRGTCDNYLFGPSRNPFDLRKNTGGSSGGSAGAVADGLLPFAEGTDGGGSIRIPASWCGVYGFTPSFGRVPNVIRPNAFAHSAPFLLEGPIAREVEDASLVLNAISGHDPRDPYSVNERVDFTAALRRSVKGMRIAFSPNLDVFPVDPRVAETVARAVQAFTEAGAHVEQVQLGIKRPARELSDVWCRLLIPLNHRMFLGMKEQGLDLLGEHGSDFPPQFLNWMESTASMSVNDFLRDQEVRAEVFDALRGVLERFDLLVSPTLTSLPVDNATDGNTLGPSEVNGEAVDPLIGWCMTYFTNFAGNPAASVPAGLVEGRYPVGMQIIGRRWADADVLAASATFERLRPWRESYRLCRERPLANEATQPANVPGSGGQVRPAVTS